MLFRSNDRVKRDPEELEEEGSQSENENALGSEAAAETLTAMTDIKEARKLKILLRKSWRLMATSKCW